MRAQQSSIVVGVFEDREQADRVVDELRRAGFRDDQIGVAMRHDEGMAGTGATDAVDNEEETEAGTGAVTGALTGLGLGALAGLGILSGVIPAVGPAIAAGTLGVILSNAAAGAGIGGLVGLLVGAGIPEHEAQYYQGEFEAGRTILTVHADGRAADAMAILRRHGAYDMSTRGDVGTSTATATGAASMAARGTSRAATSREGDTIQVKEERLQAEKRPVEAGEVRVGKEVHTETKTMEVPVQREEVVIERNPVHGRAAEGIAAGDIREGEEIRIPVREEQVEVTKQPVVTEEVTVGKRTVQDTERVSGQVRKEEVKVEKTGDVDVNTRGTGKKST
jgi:uncharacterized protein (TIGR02271 family)